MTDRRLLRKKFSQIVKWEIKSGNFWANQWTRGQVFLKQARKHGDKMMGYASGRACTIKPPCKITFTRIAPRPLDDDNLATGFKHVRDAFCAAITGTPANKIGQADGHGDITFEYKQERGKKKTYAFRVDVEATAL